MIKITPYGARKYIKRHLQEPEAILTVLCVCVCVGGGVPVNKTLTPPGNQEANALAQVQAPSTIDPSVDMANWAHEQNGHHSA